MRWGEGVGVEVEDFRDRAMSGVDESFGLGVAVGRYSSPRRCEGVALVEEIRYGP